MLRKMLQKGRHLLKIITFGLSSAFLIPATHAQVSDTIGFGTLGTNVYGPVRLGASAASSFSIKTISLYTQSELAAIGIYPGAVISSIAWQKQSNATLSNNSAITINVSLRDGIDTLSYGSTSSSNILINNYTATGFSAAGTASFSAVGNNLPADTSWIAVPFNTPYTYTGGGIEVLTDGIYVPGSGNPASAAVNWRISSSPTGSNIFRSIYTNSTTAYNSTAVCNLGTSRSNIIFTYLPGPTCNGTPFAGTIILDTLQSCPNLLKGNLILQDASAATGITVQWEKLESGQSAFTPIPGATGYEILNEVTTIATAYRAIVTCGTINVISDTMSMNPAPFITPNYIQNFDVSSSWQGNTAPGCWVGRRGLMDNPVTFLSNASGYSVGVWSNDGWGNNGTLGAAKIRATGGGSNIYDWLLSPGFNLGAASWQLDFDLGIFTNNGTGPGMLDNDDIFSVVVSTDGGITWSDNNILQSWLAANTPLSATGTQHVTIPLTSYSGNVAIGFYATGGATNPTPASLTPDIMIDNFQIVPLGTNLPVKMSNLKGAINRENYVTLNWETYEEKNNTGFSIESSKDGKTFSPLQLVPTKAPEGNSNGRLLYQYTTHEPVEQASYFRIKQSDIDQHYAYSNIVKLIPSTRGGQNFQIYPNPVTNLFKIEQNNHRINGQLSIFDISGRLIKTFAVDPNTKHFDISDFESGIYFIRYFNGTESVTRKIIKR